MRTWKLAIVALAVGTLFCGAANAANLALSLQFRDAGGTAIAPSALNAAQDFFIDIYGLATSDAGDGGAFYDFGGTYFSVTTPGTVGVAVPLVSLGKVNTSNLIAGYTNIKADDVDKDLDGDLDALNSGHYQTDPTDPPANNGVTAVRLQSQKWHTTGAPAILQIVYEPGNKYWDINTLKLVDYQSLTPFQVQIGAAVAPKPVITSGPVAEGDWSDEPGWNNPAHHVAITSDASGACIWKISDGTTDWNLTNANPLLNTANITLTIGDIIATGATLPGPYNPGDDLSGYNWTLTVTAGGQTSDGVSVFVPEPATMGLLGFGVLALLRRRRA